MNAIRTIALSILAGTFVLSACTVTKKDPLPSCETTVCDVNASCTDLVEGPICACKVGFAGGGLTCCDDEDGDKVCSGVDNCPAISNPLQEDVDSNDIGDACDEPPMISILIGNLSTTATFFTYDTSTAPVTEVAYFGVMGSDGQPHIAIDACDICYRERLGYRQEGADMVCNNCDRHFEINGLGTVNTSGGCSPGYIPVEITATEVLIDPADMDDRAWYFQ